MIAIALQAGDALDPGLVRVTDDVRPPVKVMAGTTAYAVFAGGHEDGTRFCGLVPLRAADAHPGRIFADLLPQQPQAAVTPGASLETVRSVMHAHPVDAVAVCEGEVFVGAVTRDSLQRTLLREEQRKRATSDRAHAAVLELFALSSSHGVETELLQRGINALTGLLGAKYGAIGILGPDGELSDFIHTGISPALAAQIGSLPHGKGLLEVASEHGAALRVDDMARHPRSVGFPPNHPPMKSLLAAAITLHEAAYGWVYLCDREDGKPFSATDEQLVVAYAQALAMMIGEGHGRARLSQLAGAIEQTADAVIITDATGVIEFVNPAFEQQTGFRQAEVLGKTPRILKSDHHDPRFFRKLWKQVLRGETFRDVILNRRKDGSVFHEAMSIAPIRNDRGAITHFVSAGSDVTAFVETRDLVTRLGEILDRSANEIYVFDATTLRFLQVNAGAQENLGYSREELDALTPVDLYPEFDSVRFEALLAPLRLGEQEIVIFESEHRRKEGSRYPVEIRLQWSGAEQTPVFVAIVLDITERRRQEARLNFLAYHDSLTGLPNRVALIDHLVQAMAEADRHKRLVAVLFVDLDRFKNINDTLGHDAGDRLLTAVAQRLSGCVRPGDTVGRHGGDEFTMVLANVAHVDHVATVAQTIMNHFREPFCIEGCELFVSLSVGIALYPLDHDRPDVLLRHADAAMYHAKESGRDNFQFFIAEINERMHRQLDLDNALRQALERQEFLLHYQPQIDLATGQVIGVEALVRWQRGGEMVSPLEFIPRAEETGLIVPIGEWVLIEACRQLQAWDVAGGPALRMAVNLSPRQFREASLAGQIEAVLDQFDLAPERLMLELTEGVLMHDPEGAFQVLNGLHAQGIQLAVDDFGTGYSSLGYLNRFPLDELKIDKSFVGEITENPEDAAIAHAVIQLARSLGIQVMAEGVETSEQLAFLCQRGCQGGQGYYFSRPLPSVEVMAFLAEQSPFSLPSIQVCSPPAQRVSRFGGRH